MEADARIKIIMSEELIAIKLGDIAGRYGTIEEDLTSLDRTNRGYIVNLEDKYLNETNWFIPEVSISKLV